MATWRVFKQQDPRPLPEGVKAGWWEYGTIENDYSYAIDAQDLGPVAGEGTYLAISDEWRACEIEVAARTTYVAVLQLEPEPVEQHSVAVPE